MLADELSSLYGKYRHGRYARAMLIQAANKVGASIHCGPELVTGEKHIGNFIQTDVISQKIALVRLGECVVYRVTKTASATYFPLHIYRISMIK